MMRKCHLNTCPVGIATQDPELRAKFEGTPEEVVNYLFLVAEETRRLMASLGVATMRELVGRTDLFLPELAVRNEKTEGLDLSAVLGAFLAPGITIELEGDGNDYVGKGLSGGRLILYPPRRSRFVAEENVLIGNVALYGATGGEAFFRGRAAERFCVRNSGARAVIEGIGDHGCEYMTGGRAVILGPTGRNFAAGMSGGIAWVFDPHKDLENNCNFEMVGLEPVGDEYRSELRQLVARHARFTGSTVARRLLERWSEAVRQFLQVMPHDYRRVLLARGEAGERMPEDQTIPKAEAAA